MKKNKVKNNNNKIFKIAEDGRIFATIMIVIATFIIGTVVFCFFTCEQIIKDNAVDVDNDFKETVTEELNYMYSADSIIEKQMRKETDKIIDDSIKSMEYGYNIEQMKIRIEANKLNVLKIYTEQKNILKYENKREKILEWKRKLDICTKVYYKVYNEVNIMDYKTIKELNLWAEIITFGYQRLLLLIEIYK
jgi:hypothetical protein